MKNRLKAIHQRCPHRIRAASLPVTIYDQSTVHFKRRLQSVANLLNFVPVAAKDDSKNRSDAARPASIAQLVEQGTLNPWVLGSSPSGGTQQGRASDRLARPFSFRTHPVPAM